jgi:glycerol-3-phosphate dehydrogenase
MIASEGTHIVFPGEYCHNDYGLIIPKTEDGRMIFILPFEGKTLAGTTDNIYPVKTNHPLTDLKAVDMICREVAKLYPEKDYEIKE